MVHHRNFPDVLRTVEAVLASGVLPENAVLVDNSEDAAIEEALRDSLPEGVRLTTTQNVGYGNAVNVGKRTLLSDRRLEFVLVSTHETRPASNAVFELREALVGNSQKAVAGPTLLASWQGREITWSRGGSLTKVLNEPRHVGMGSLVPSVSGGPCEEREWVDGAFALYRAEALAGQDFDERFFLYFEEVEYHARLRASGLGVVWVPSAVVRQASNGVPTYLLTRNLQMFQALHGTKRHRAVTVPIVMARRLGKATLTGKLNLDDARDLLRGWRDGVARGWETPRRTVTLVNPLRAALAHYEEVLVATLESAGANVRTVGFQEPSASGRSSFAWLTEYLRSLLTLRRKRDGHVLILWPVLGYLDLLLALIVGRGQVTVVMHDPRPLVHARGYGRTARWLAGRRIFGGRAMAQSQQALDVLKEDSTLPRVDCLPLPIARSESDPADDAPLDRPMVRVLGQFKPDRDLDALRRIAEQVSGTFTLEIIGRRWPEVAGWDVTDTFIPEEDFDAIVRESSVVVIPYARFYQSDIAIRCIENGVPVVGPSGTSLEELLGSDHPWLVRGDWVAAIRAAVSGGPAEARAVHRAYYDHSVESWGEWLTEHGLIESGNAQPRSSKRPL